MQLTGERSSEKNRSAVDGDRSAANDRLTLARRSVLVVDDDPDYRQAVTEILDYAGYSVTEAADGAEALAALESGFRPAAILLDLMMPKMNGWQLWDQIQLKPALRIIPVVVVTSTGLTTGALGKSVPILQKSVRADVVLATLDRVVAASGPSS